MKKYEATLIALTTVFSGFYFTFLHYTLSAPVNIISATNLLLSSLLYAAWIVSVIIIALTEETKDTLL